jgi:hypothetical protein
MRIAPSIPSGAAHRHTFRVRRHFDLARRLWWLSRDQSDRMEWPIQSPWQGCRAQFGGLAAQFPRHALARDRAADRHCRAAASRSRLRRVPGRPDFPRLQAWGRLHHRDRRLVDVSHHLAVEHSPKRFAHRVRRLVEPGNPSCNC